MSGKTILLVEDNPSDIELTRRALERSRVANDLVVVEDGEQALEYLSCTGAFASRNPCELPALVLLDLKLPKIDGLGVLEWLRKEERTRRLPVVVLTSSAEERDVANSYDLGVNSYIRKPVDFVQFAAAIQQLGLYWLVLNAPPPAQSPK
jgi:two-component system, response regulator